MELVRNATDDNGPLKPALGHRLNAINDLARSLLSVVNEIEEVRVIDFTGGINLQSEVLRYETDLIRRALKLTGNHQLRAARMLNIKPTTLNAKIKRYQIQI